jgi:hypothetical protein
VAGLYTSVRAIGIEEVPLLPPATYSLPRLRGLKRKHDPTKFFRPNQNIQP